jgi:MFS family permease
LNSGALRTAGYQRRFLALLFLVSLFNLSDTHIGLLQGLSFALLYGGLGLPIGRLAERYSRINIIAMATTIWSIATACTGMAATYGQMLLSRVGVGMGEAGFTAPA